VDDLLGVNPLSARPQSTHYHLSVGDQQDGFWGHIGLKVVDRPAKWFPVTSGTAGRVRSELAAIESNEDWVAFPTLANRYVAIRPAGTRKIWLLDDACDGPEGDWEYDPPYEGLPLEMYRAFDQMTDLPFSEQDWAQALAALPSESDKGEFVGGDPQAWRAFVSEVGKTFNGEASETFLSSVSQAFGSMRLYDEDSAYRTLHYTTLHFLDGTVEEAWLEEDGLKEFLLDLGSAPKLIRLERLGGGGEMIYSASGVSAVAAPLIDLLDAWKRDEEGA
jgi:hypothetical protein